MLRNHDLYILADDWYLRKRAHGPASSSNPPSFVLRLHLTICILGDLCDSDLGFSVLGVEASGGGKDLDIFSPSLIMAFFNKEHCLSVL
jgi:hypothetical protein